MFDVIKLAFIEMILGNQFRKLDWVDWSVIGDGYQKTKSFSKVIIMWGRQLEKSSALFFLFTVSTHKNLHSWLKHQYAIFE